MGRGDGRVLAVDLGGTNLRAAVITPGGTLTHRQAVPTGAAEGPDAVLARMIALAGAVATAAALDPAAAIGIASPGPIDPHTGVVLFTPNLPGWRDVPLGPRIAAATGRPVVVQNDANLAAWGEVHFGAARGARDVVYLGLGTGVGGGVIAGGCLIDGTRGLGAELGHVCIGLDGPRCTCGQIGCLEAYVGGWAISREGRLVASTADGAAIRAAAGARPVTPTVIAAAAATGDPAATAVLARAGRALGAAMGTFINIFNPEMLVIGGGVATLGELLLGPARAALVEHSFPAIRAGCRLERAILGDDAGLFGAAALAMGRSG